MHGPLPKEMKGVWRQGPGRVSSLSMSPQESDEDKSDYNLVVDEVS